MAGILLLDKLRQTDLTNFNENTGAMKYWKDLYFSLKRFLSMKTNPLMKSLFQVRQTKMEVKLA